MQITENSKARDIYRTVNSGGSFGASSLRPHIGLGKATAIDELDTVAWQRSCPDGERPHCRGHYVRVTRRRRRPKITPRAFGGNLGPNGALSRPTSSDQYTNGILETPPRGGLSFCMASPLLGVSGHDLFAL